MDDKTIAHKLLVALADLGRNIRQQHLNNVMSFREVRINILIDENRHCYPNGVPIRIILQELNVSKSSLTRSLNNLEKNGFIEKTKDKDNNRFINIKLTEFAIKDIEKKKIELLEFMNEVVKNMGTDNAEDLIKLMDLLHVHFNLVIKKKKLPKFEINKEVNNIEILKEKTYDGKSSKDV